MIVTLPLAGHAYRAVAVADALTARGLTIGSVTVALYALGAFILPWLFLGPVAGAAVGLILYAAALGVVRPAPLRESWGYLRALA